MADGLTISGDGSFEVAGHMYHIPAQFAPREIFSYRRLLEPIPSVPGGTELSAEQLTVQKAYLFRRAAACVIPGLEAGALETLSLAMLTEIHRWILAHRAGIIVDVPMSA